MGRRTGSEPVGDYAREMTLARERNDAANKNLLQLDCGSTCLLWQLVHFAGDRELGPRTNLARLRNLPGAAGASIVGYALVCANGVHVFVGQR
jgi:hypothetical protein